jgi:hypothetical protein
MPQSAASGSTPTRSSASPATRCPTSYYLHEFSSDAATRLRLYAGITVHQPARVLAFTNA